MTYTRMDRLMDEAALGYSFSRRTRLVVWIMRKTWPLWRESNRMKSFWFWIFRKTIVKPRAYHVRGNHDG